MTRSDRRTADRRIRSLAWAVLLAAAATGCVTMPSGGPPERLEVSQGAADGLQVHVYPVAPHPGENLGDLLTGFLDSSNADQANYDTAKQYLTADAAKRWRPDAGVVVLSDAPRVTHPTPDQGDSSAQLTVSGRQVAELDGRHTYQARLVENYQQVFTFVKETEGPNKGEWRIDGLPDGLIVDQTNFKNGYKPVHRYFFARTDPTNERSANTPVLVPDPIYLRRRIDPLTEAASAVAAGPSQWLSPVVYSALDGVRVLGATVGDNRVTTVRVDGVDLGANQVGCQQMAQQLFQTLADQQGKLERLDLASAKGGCSVGSGQAAQVAPGALAGESTGVQAYIRLEDGRLTRYQDGVDPVPVAGVLGQAPQPGQPKPGEIAVRRDGAAAAVIGQDGHNLYVTGLTEGDKLGDPVVPPRAPGANPALASPSWDGRGDLWLVDRDPAAPRVLMVRGRTTVQVGVDGLDGRAVQSLRISSDGTRVAMVVKSPNAPATLVLGLVVHSGTPAAPQARIIALRNVAPQLAEVAAVGWGDTDQLVVLGKETDRLQQLHFLGTDGSQSTDSPLQGGESMTALSATEARTAGDQVGPAVLTVSHNGLYRLKDNQWHEVPSKIPAVAFSYPG
ncbi:LpqB family beta-propeller domain-containing protein [Kitasatospora sp. NPDC049285]|uniref:LpqB family beta-propeller domain-containing protein n=1 Tax=Kitasatospora sp. NPDC049285 TaxID=3157096 RepID=UPI00343723D3